MQIYLIAVFRIISKYSKLYLEITSKYKNIQSHFKQQNMFIYYTLHILYNDFWDPVHTIPVEFENGTKFLRLGVAFTRWRYEKMWNRNANRKSLKTICKP